MTSLNKLSLRQFVKTQRSFKTQIDNSLPPTQNHPTQNSLPYQNNPIENSLPLSQNFPTNNFFPGIQNQTQQRSIKKQKTYHLSKQTKKLKLNTLPCEEIENQKQPPETFLFRSTWEDDIQHLKQQMKGCTSPTFATQILSTGNNQCNLFHGNSSNTKEQQEDSTRNRSSNSRQKFRHNKSLQKFIGDNVSTHRSSNSMVQKVTKQGKQKTLESPNNDYENLLYQNNKLQSLNYQLKRQNKKIQEKYLQLKNQNQQLQDNQRQKTLPNNNPSISIMSNQELLQKMRTESFWKFYLKAEKMIRSSITETNHQSSLTPINFLKELQALRELTSSMKKENKALKKLLDQTQDQLESNKDKLSIQQAQIEEMRLNCVAYEKSIRKLREEMSNYQKDIKKVGEFKDLQVKLSQKSADCLKISKQLSSITLQLQEQKLLNTECQKQRLGAKKKCQQLNEEIQSLNKQLCSLKTSYNLLQIQKQQLSANKKQMIEKEKLKEKVYQLQKQLKSLSFSKDQQLNKLKDDYEYRYGKQIELKESRVKELDQKVEKILSSLQDLQLKNNGLSEQKFTLQQQLSQLQQQNQQLQEERSIIHNQLSAKNQKREQKLSELSSQLQGLTLKFEEQLESLLSQEELIRQLRAQIDQKEQMIRVKEQESSRLRESLVKMEQQSLLKMKEQEKKSQNKNNKEKNSHDNNMDQYMNRDNSISSQQDQEITQLQQYIRKLQEKYNEAMELYQSVYNEKVQLQLQLQYYENKFQQATQQQQHHNLETKQRKPNSRSNHQQSYGATEKINSEILEMIESLLTIKEEIIKKTLLFCPSECRQLLVQYIYYGDMIKETYLHLITCSNSIQNQSDIYKAQSHIAPRNTNDNRSKTNNHLFNRNQQKNENGYNPNSPYLIEIDDCSQTQQNQYKENEINFFLQEFIKIGKAIDQKTILKKKSYLPPKTTKFFNLQNKQNDTVIRESKEKQLQTLRKHINNKINMIKNNQNSQVCLKNQQKQQNYKKPVKNLKDIYQNQKQLQKNNQYRQPLDQITEKAPYSISRPLFTPYNIKNQIKSTIPQEDYPNKPCFYQQPKETLRSNNSQLRYQKQELIAKKNNFNLGISNKLNFMKLNDRVLK